MSRWFLLALSLVLGSGCADVLDEERGRVRSPSGNGGGRRFAQLQQGRDRLPCTSPREPLNFPTFWAGPSFDGLDISAVIRDCALPYPGEQIRTNDVSYLYGECTPGLDGGCAVPITVQTWPALERNRSSIDPDVPGGTVRRTDTTVAGSPAAWYGDRLEVYETLATIVIHGDDRARTERFAAALVRAPDVLTDLAAYGFEFDEDCVDDRHYCVAKA